jgi:hypothetical protein
MYSVSPEVATGRLLEVETQISINPLAFEKTSFGFAHVPVREKTPKPSDILKIFGLKFASACKMGKRLRDILR